MSKKADLYFHQIDRSKLPQHVAIIMDGNGRWARKRHMPRIYGHKVGADSVRDVVEAAGTLGIKYLTLYAFSTENWSRPKSEVAGLMKLLQFTLKNEEGKLNRSNVRLETIGDISSLSKEVLEQLALTRTRLSKNTGLCLVLALNYGGRQDIIQAANALMKEGHGRVTEKMLSERLYTAPYPDPDLVIRTSGEFRVSNFLLWQVAYSEFHITPVLWPDFRREHFYQAILEFQARERRFGGLG